MSGSLDSVMHFINSPPGEFVTGVVLAGVVWKFFGRVESVLSDSTKFEIAVWLVGVDVGRALQCWPQTLAQLFDRVFGRRYFSWRCFSRSCVASFGSFVIGLLVSAARDDARPELALSLLEEVRAFFWFAAFVVPISIGPDYLSLLKTRLILKMMTKTTKVWSWFGLIIVDGIITLIIAFNSVTLGFALAWSYGMGTVHSPGEALLIMRDLYQAPISDFTDNAPFVYPAFFASAWLWLYATAGGSLKAARHFDVGFQWFNRKFDIERKPLQAIGFVASLLVAAVWWGLLLTEWIGTSF